MIRQFGMFSAPSWTITGVGISDAVNAYTPFWINPALNKTYGYNLLAASNTTAALLDTPDPVVIQQFQNSLRLGDSLRYVHILLILPRRYISGRFPKFSPIESLSADDGF